MANPPGTRANRWNQAVSAVVGETGVTTAAADLWLNAVWLGMYVDEVQGDPAAYLVLRKWLEFNYPTAPTLPMAFRASVI